MKDSKWPDRLSLRDTGIYDDLGGMGQRIYTTAGAGYEKCEYVRADLLIAAADGVMACPDAHDIRGIVRAAEVRVGYLRGENATKRGQACDELAGYIRQLERIALGVLASDAASEDSKAEAIAAALMRFAGYSKDEARACSRLILSRGYAEAARGVMAAETQQEKKHG